MLFVLHGTDIKKARKKLHELTESLLAKKPDSNLFSLTDETFHASKIDEYTRGQGLFAQNYIVVLDGVLDHKPHEDIVIEKLDDISTSTNVFIIIEELIDTKALKKIQKSATKVQDFFVKEIAPKKEYKLFTLTDAFGARNKLATWVEFQRATKNHISAEEIHSMLIWQLRSMIIASESSTAKEAGLNPFVYKKAKSFAQNFSNNELKMLSGKLVSLFHRSRRGEYALADGIERMILAS